MVAGEQKREEEEEPGSQYLLQGCISIWLETSTQTLAPKIPPYLNSATGWGQNL